MEEDKIEENEDVYMFKTQIGKFNTTFQQEEMDDLQMVDEDLTPDDNRIFTEKSLLIAVTLQNSQNKMSNNQANMQINTITEHMSENSVNLSTQPNLKPKRSDSFGAASAARTSNNPHSYMRGDSKSSNGQPQLINNESLKFTQNNR